MSVGTIVGEHDETSPVWGHGSTVEAVSSPDVVAAIDVGTNSVHMVVARIVRTGFDVISTEKEVVRLGAGLDGDDEIAPAAIERGVAALVRMSRIAEAHGARVRAVATSAVREAPNREEFLAAVRGATGIDVEVISGGEEARLIHLGVGRSLDLRAGSVLTIDIGGGSTEFCVSVRGSLRIAQSLKIGAVRMTDSHLPGGIVTDNGVRKLREKIRSTLAPLAHEISRVGFDRVVVSSGTNEALARMAAAARGVSPLNMNGFVFTARELDDVTEEVLDRVRPEQRVDLEGLETKRADIIAAGAVILREIGRVLKISSFEYSDFALREGVLVDAARRLGLMDADPVDPGLESATRLAERFSVDMNHSTHVAHLAGCLLRAVGRHYEVDPSLERLLRAAALLANTGNAIGHARHHVHSYYIIRNADLVGFVDEEIEIIALAARYHRKGGPKESHDEFARLSADRRHDVELLAAVLRIATALDQSRDQCVVDVRSSLRDGRLDLAVIHRCATPEQMELNVETAAARTAMLAEYLGDDVRVRDGGAPRN